MCKMVDRKKLLLRTWLHSKNARYCGITVLALIVVQVVLSMDGNGGGGRDNQGSDKLTSPPKRHHNDDDLAENIVKDSLRRFAENVPEKSSHASQKKDEVVVKKKLSKKEEKTAQVEPIVSGAVQMIDKLVKANGNKDTLESYNMIKSMIMLWNPEASKWAGNASAVYKYGARRHFAYPILTYNLLICRKQLELLDEDEASWSPVEDPVEMTEVSSVLEQCGCTRKVMAAATDAALNASMCSEHSFDRGSHQRVHNYSAGFRLILSMLTRSGLASDAGDRLLLLREPGLQAGQGEEVLPGHQGQSRTVAAILQGVDNQGLL